MKMKKSDVLRVGRNMLFVCMVAFQAMLFRDLGNLKIAPTESNTQIVRAEIELDDIKKNNLDNSKLSSSNNITFDPKQHVKDDMIDQNWNTHNEVKDGSGEEESVDKKDGNDNEEIYGVLRDDEDYDIDTKGNNGQNSHTLNKVNNENSQEGNMDSTDDNGNDEGDVLLDEDHNLDMTEDNGGLNNYGSSNKYEVGLHFCIAGFPKTGTSSMMNYLNSNGELRIINPRVDQKAKLSEYHIHDEDDIEQLFSQIRDEHGKSDKDERYGIKWPSFIRKNIKQIQYLQQHNPQGLEMKIIVGLRHPVRWFESFYNYRAKKLDPPPSVSLIGQDDWKGVDTDTARFEMGIMQLGKIPLRQEDEKWIKDHRKMDIVPSAPYKVLLYLQEQLDDENKERKSLFLKDLSSFMEVKQPFTVDNEVPEFNRNKHKKYDICQAEHDEVRRVLVENGKKTAEWIRTFLVEADDFFLPNKDHFLNITDTFGSDPCDEEGVSGFS